MTVGKARALANPQFGDGGYTQFYVPNYSKNLTPGVTMPLKNK